MRTIKEILLSSNGSKRKVRALFDTGATINYISPEASRAFPGLIAVPNPFRVGLGGKKHVVKEALSLTVNIEDHRMPSQFFHVVDLKNFDVIIGAFFMEQWGVKLDPGGRKLEIKRDRFDLQEEY